MLNWGCPKFVPISTEANTIATISIISSNAPIPIIDCPSLVLTILNSSSIGRRTTSPTVANDEAKIIEIIQETSNT